MSDDESNQIKIFNQYQIKLTSNMDYINILIQNKNNTFNNYESKFNLEYLHQFRLLMGNLTIEQMIEFINNLIDGNDINIEESGNNLKLILISKNYPNVELKINKNNIIEKLINEIEEIRNENKILKNNYEEIKNKIASIEEENKKLNSKIVLNEKIKIDKENIDDGIEKVNTEKNEEYKKLNMRIESIENEKEILKNKIDSIINLNKKTKINEEENLKKIEKEKVNNEELYKKIELIEKNNKELNDKIEKKNEIINEINNKLKILEEHHKNQQKKKIQLTKCDLKNINSIEPHNNSITSVSTFPSGNIISVSLDKSIIIYDINLNILQNIQNAHNDFITYVEVKDENNFVTCSRDKSIKLWIKNENEFINNKIINNAHENDIMKVIYYSNENLISCSLDKTIKIWKENDNNNYKNMKTLTHSKGVCSISYLEDKNILISSGYDGTKFWNLNKNENNYNNINCIQYFENVKCGSNNGLCRLDEDRIIVGSDSLKIISILKKIIIEEIKDISLECLGIRLIDDKGIFLIGGNSGDIKVYRKDNYECIQIIKDAHDYDINGFVELKDESILSYSWDGGVKIWK